MGLQKGCPCCTIKQNEKAFIKVMDFSAGLVIYRFKPSQPEKNVDTNDMFIIHNATNRHVSTANCMSEIEETVYCPRCRYIMRHAKDLLLNLSFIQKRDVIGICDHCRLREQSNKPCTKCEIAIKEFIKDNQKSKINIQKNISKQVKELTSSMKDFLLDVPETRKLGPSEAKRRTQSEPSDKLDITYKSRSDRDDIMSKIGKSLEKEFLRKRETRQLYDKKSRSELSVIDAVKFQKNIEFKRDIQFMSPKNNVSLKSFTESSDYISFQNKYYSQRASASKKDVRTDVPAKRQPSSELTLFSDTSFTESKTIEDKLKLIGKEKSKKQILHDGKYIYKKKHHYSYDDIRGLKQRHGDFDIEKELLKDVQKITESDTNIVKYTSDESLRSFSAATRQISRKGFSYFFIKESDFPKKRYITNLSSSELVKNTQDMYRERAEKAKIKKEQEEKRKLEEKEKKRIVIEERKKLKAEEQRIKELNKKLAEEEQKRVKQMKDDQELKRKQEQEAEIEKVQLKSSSESKIEKQSHKSDKESSKMKEEFSSKEKKVKAKLERNDQRSAADEEKQRKNKKEKEKEKADKQEQMRRAQETKKKQKEEKEKEKQEQMLRAQETKKKQKEEKEREKQEQMRAAEETKMKQKEEKEKEKEEQIRRAQEAKQRQNDQKEKEKALNEEQMRLIKEEKQRLKEEKEKAQKEQHLAKEEKLKLKDQKEIDKPKNEQTHLIKEEKPSKKAEIAKEKEDIVKVDHIEDQTTKADKNYQNMAALILGKKDQESKPKKKQEDERKKQEAQKKFKSLKETKEEVKSEKPELKKVVEEPQTKELNINQVKIRRPSPDDLILELVKLKQARGGPKVRPTRLSQINISEKVIREHKDHKDIKNETCMICLSSDLELDIDNIIFNEKKVDECNDIIIGQKIFKYKPSLPVKSEEVEKGPLLFASKHIDDDIISNTEVNENLVEEKERNIPLIHAGKYVEQEVPKGIIRYALSDRTFIEKGWTMLPTEKVVRKMNVYRMRPAHPEFDWFEHNKNKKLICYDTGEKLAEFDDNGKGRWFYRSGKVALDYYDAEELNAQQRIVIYGSGECDESGRPRPLTILATFDYLGNGIVFDHSGKIRLKYNQTEGVVLDRSIGPVSHWKWHTLNDPPVLQQVMIDTQMSHKDPEILKLGGPNENKPRPDNEEMLAIEFDNFIKEKSKKLSQTFKPFQIKMKALKINEYFSLKVLDQATIYLIYRDGTTNLKLNIGMLLDHQEIVDTDTAEVGEVSNSLERFPARTDSLAGLQKSVAHAQRVEHSRVERERRLRPTQPISSVDRLTSGLSRPLRTQLHTVASTSDNRFCKCRKPSTTTLYYDTRLN